MTAQQIDVHGLPAKWREISEAADSPRGSAALRFCARELGAALRQSGEAVAEVGPAWTLLWAGGGPLAEICRKNPSLRIGSKLYLAPPATSGLVEALRSIFQYGADTLSGRADGGADDRKWQRDAVLEMTRRAKAALATHDARGVR